MPRPARVSQEQILQSMGRVFRSKGFEGSTLEDLSAATGLVKAALYHRFVGGKLGMARAVLEHVRAQSIAHSLAALLSPGPPRKRLEAFADAIRVFYDDGNSACLLEAFSNGEALVAFRDQLGVAISDLIGAIAAVLIEAGFGAEEANRRAEDAVVRIQGSLVVSRLQLDPGAFLRVVTTLPDTLLPIEGAIGVR